jgi:hypothetical protein
MPNGSGLKEFVLCGLAMLATGAASAQNRPVKSNERPLSYKKILKSLPMYEVGIGLVGDYSRTTGKKFKYDRKGVGGYFCMWLSPNIKVGGEIEILEAKPEIINSMGVPVSPLPAQHNLMTGRAVGGFYLNPLVVPLGQNTALKDPRLVARAGVKLGFGASSMTGSWYQKLAQTGLTQFWQAGLDLGVMAKLSRHAAVFGNLGCQTVQPFRNLDDPYNLRDYGVRFDVKFGGAFTF